MRKYVLSTSSANELLHHKDIPPPARRTETLLTLNQTQQAPDIQTRPTLRRSAVGRGKLRASRRSLLHTYQAPPRELDQLLWPVHCCLKALTLSSLTQISMHVCVRKSPQMHCVLTSTNTAVSSCSPREHSSSVRRCTCTESYGNCPKTNPSQVPASSVTQAQQTETNTNVANTQHPVGPIHLTGNQNRDVHTCSRQTRRPAVPINPETPPKSDPGSHTQIKRSTHVVVVKAESLRHTTTSAAEQQQPGR